MSYAIEVKYISDSKNSLEVEAGIDNFYVKPYLGTAGTYWLSVPGGGISGAFSDTYCVYTNTDTVAHAVKIGTVTPPMDTTWASTDFFVVLPNSVRILRIEPGQNIWVKTLAGNGIAP